MSIEGARQQIREILRCPVRDEGEFYTKAAMEQLLHFWVEVVSSYPYQVRDEGDLAIHWYETDLEDREDAKGLEWDALNLKGWIGKARRVFLRRVRPIIQMHMVPPKHRKKHWVSSKLRDEQVRTRTEDGDSLFLPLVKTEHMVQAVWLLMGQYFEDGLSK